MAREVFRLSLRMGQRIRRSRTAAGTLAPRSAITNITITHEAESTLIHVPMGESCRTASEQIGRASGADGHAFWRRG